MFGQGFYQMYDDSIAIPHPIGEACERIDALSDIVMSVYEVPILGVCIPLVNFLAFLHSSVGMSDAEY